MPEQGNVSALILAAGASARLGQPKQLLPWRKKTLVEHAVSQLLPLHFKEVLVVLGANYQEVIQVLEQYPVNVLYHQDWKQGMGKSLAFGMQQMLKNIDTEAILVTLVDQPLIAPAYLKMMLQAFRQNPQKIVATSYEGKPGVPAIFPIGIAEKLTTLQGDYGAGKWMRKHRENIYLMPTGTDTLDIDTLEDYFRAMKKS